MYGVAICIESDKACAKDNEIIFTCLLKSGSMTILSTTAGTFSKALIKFSILPTGFSTTFITSFLTSFASLNTSSPMFPTLFLILEIF
jgi:hypothetical protein